MSTKNRSQIKSRLREEILNMINDEVTVFVAGGALGFDTLAAEQVIDMREDYDFIRLILYLPCHNQDADWSMADRDRFLEIKSQADEIYYVTDGEYTEGCMKKRNRAMVEASDCGIVYMLTSHSGAAQTIKMARDKGLYLVNIADKIKNEVN